MSNVKIGYEDVAAFFRQVNGTACETKSATYQPGPVSSEYGTSTPPPITLQLLHCKPVNMKELPEFTLRINGSFTDINNGDLNCSNLEEGGLVCYAKENDFSFVLERDKDTLKIASGHVVAYPEEMSNKAKTLLSFIRSIPSAAFWVPASW